MLLGALVALITTFCTPLLFAQNEDTSGINARWTIQFPLLRVMGPLDGILMYDSKHGNLLYTAGGKQNYISRNEGKTFTGILDSAYIADTLRYVEMDDEFNYYYTAIDSTRARISRRSTDGGNSWSRFEPSTHQLNILGITKADLGNVTVVAGVPAFVLRKNDTSFITYSLDGGMSFYTTTLVGYRSHTVLVDTLTVFGVDTARREYSLLDLRTGKRSVHPDPATGGARAIVRLHDSSLVCLGRNGEHETIWARRSADEMWSAFVLSDLHSDDTVRRVKVIDGKTCLLVTDRGDIFTVNSSTLQLTKVYSVHRQDTVECFEMWTHGRDVVMQMYRRTARPDSLELEVRYSIDKGTTSERWSNGPGGWYSFIRSALSTHQTAQHIAVISDSLLFRLIPIGGYNGKIVISRDGGTSWTEFVDVDAVQAPFNYDGVTAIGVRSDSQLVVTKGSRVTATGNIHQPDSWRAVFLSGNELPHPHEYDPDQRIFHDGWGSIPIVKDKLIGLGDAVTRWSIDGRFVDTLLDHRATFFRLLPFSGIYASGYDTLWFSFDQGLEWTAVNLDIQKSAPGMRAPIGDVLELPSGTILLGLRGRWFQIAADDFATDRVGGIWRTTDRGDTWENMSTDLRMDTYVSALYRNPRTGTLIACAGNIVDRSLFATGILGPPIERQSFGIYRSTDDGESWERTFSWGNHGTELLHHAQCSIDPHGDLHLVAFPRYYLRSRDDGKTWSFPHTEGIQSALVYSLCESPNGESLYLATTRGLCEITSSTTSSADEQQLQGSIDQLYVQQTDGSVDVSFPHIDHGTMRVFSIRGQQQTVLSIENQSSVTVDVSSLVRGVYIIVVEHGKSTYSGRISIP